MNRITRFEALAERLVEGTFARLFAGRLQAHEVGLHLARAMEDNMVTSPEGITQAPTRYLVHIHPDTLADLANEQPTIERELSATVAQLAAQANVILQSAPVVQLVTSAALGPHEVDVEARWDSNVFAEQDPTQAMTAAVRDGSQAASARTGPAFLILEGRRHVDLTQPVVTIGRSLDNDIVIEDRRVSRHHAQIRSRYGRYVLYDLGSRGGTRINGYPIEECVLHSGDVISLAGIEIIYGEDAIPGSPPPSHEDTPTLSLPTTQDHEDRSG